MAKKYSKQQKQSYVEGKIVGYREAMKKCGTKKGKTSTTKKPSKRR